MEGGMLIAHDLTARVTSLLTTAGDVAFRLGLPLTLLHVVSDADFESFARDQPAGSGYVDALIDRRRDELSDRAVEALGADHAREVDFRVRRGEVAETVVKELRDGGFAFAAVGIRTRSRVGKLVFGSAVQSILLQSPCPVLSVPID